MDTERIGKAANQNKESRVMKRKATSAGVWIRRMGFAAVVMGGLPGAAWADSPAKGGASQEAPPATATVTGTININTATAAELEMLPGVGPSRAEAILTSRKQRVFEKVEDIMRVKGIGRATFRELRPLLTTQGATTLKPAAKGSASKAAPQAAKP